MAYASLADIKTHLGITGSGEDTFIGNLQDQIDAAIDAYCDRPDGFASATHTSYLDGGAVSTLLLRNTTITSITSVHDDLNRAFDSGSLIAADDYNFIADTGELNLITSNFNNRQGTFQNGTGNVKVIYVGGYSTIPEDIQLAAIVLISKYFNLRRSAGISQMSAGGLSLSFDHGFPPEAKTLLKKYREIL